MKHKQIQVPIYKQPAKYVEYMENTVETLLIFDLLEIQMTRHQPQTSIAILM